MLEEIGNWRPLGMLTPRFACVNQAASDYFSDIRPSIMEICQNPPTRKSIFIRGQNYIFICPATWTIQEEPISPDHRSCPEIAANKFTTGIPSESIVRSAYVPTSTTILSRKTRFANICALLTCFTSQTSTQRMGADPIKYEGYRSNIILGALVKWRLQHLKLPLFSPTRLNDMVALTDRESYLSPINYDAYISSRYLSQIVLRELIRVCSGEKSVHQIPQHSSLPLVSITFSK